MYKQQHGFSVLEIIMAVAIVGLIGAVGWLFWNNAVNKPVDEKPVTITQSPEPSPAASDDGVYTSKATGLAFDYPSTWKISDDSANYYSGSLSDSNRGTQDHKKIVSPQGFELYFSSRSYGGLGGAGPCDRTLTDFKNHGASKLGADIVSYSINSNVGSTFALYLTKSSSPISVADDCLGYGGIVQFSEPKIENNEYSDDPYAIEFGTSAVGRDNNKPEIVKPSGAELNEAIAILKSLRRAS